MVFVIFGHFSSSAGLQGDVSEKSQETFARCLGRMLSMFLQDVKREYAEYRRDRGVGPERAEDLTRSGSTPGLRFADSVQLYPAM